MSNQTLFLDDNLYRYLIAHSLREPAILEDLRRETAKLEQANMQIAPEQGQFMNLLTRLIGARRIIEIGTFTGYSAICMARALPEDGRLVACDISERWTRIAEHYWRRGGIRERIDLRLAPALQTLDDLLAEDGSGTFDMAFIDADKENYQAYFERCLRLMRHGGVILFDNTFWGGRVADPDFHDPDTRAIRALNTHLHHDERIDLSILPIGDGLTLARKRP